MIRAIVFDCFGVLAGDGWLPFKQKYFGHDKELFTRAGDLNRQVDAGLADYDEFIREVARLAGIPEHEAYQQIEENPPHHELFDYIRQQLKPAYKLGMLSNAGANWLPEMFSKEQIALFDAIALSYEIGVTKPDPRAYHIIADRLDVAPDECVFIDDQERYCTAAAAEGMHAVRFTTFAALKPALAKILQ